MNEMDSENSERPYEAYDRTSICISNEQLSEVAHLGDPGFRKQMERNFMTAESNALEQTFQLKQRLRSATTWDFWQILMEGMVNIMGSQYAFVAKRVLYDDQNTAVEMPPIGEPGSCLMGLAFYFNDHQGRSGLYRDYKYEVYGCPCQWMRHDKVLVIPEGLKTLTPKNPNETNLPILPDGYLAVPLFHGGKCFAHMGVMWTADGLKNRPKLGWGMLEMFLHALEDQVTARILEGKGFGPADVQISQHEVVPQQAVTSKQSLRPYARSLSHELRTPMQGVVGMLDVMYASVLEATEWETSDKKQIRTMVEALRENIEVAQDSSRRAVDAADNMVHAYDFDMEVPSTPSSIRDILLEMNNDEPDETDVPICTCNHDLIPTPTLPSRRANKRRRESGSPEETPARKFVHLEDEAKRPQSAPERLSERIPECDSRADSRAESRSPRATSSPPHGRLQHHGTPRRSESIVPLNGVVAAPSPTPPGTVALIFDAAGKVQLNSRPVKLRELLHQVIHETLKSGGRPDYTKTLDTALGERVMVQSKKSGGTNSIVQIELVVDEIVPETLIVDGMALNKLLSSVFHNAVKFTDHGYITVTATIVESQHAVLFSIADTGEGIPEDFLPRLFKAFSRENDSTTRSRDGLGLGLMVSKGLARKMGGDLWCQRTSTEGSNQGTEFQIKLPLTPSDALSLPGTPIANPGTPNSTPALGVSTPNIATWPVDSAQKLRPLSAKQNSVSLRPFLLQDNIQPSTSTRTALFAVEQSDSPLTPSTPTKRNRSKTQFDKELGKKLPLRILVAEDNKINRKLLTNMLRKLGFTEIYEACDGKEAVQQMETDRPYPINVVLMDLWMPKMDGYEATERILSMPKYAIDPVDGKKRLTILAVSADATAEALEKASTVGMEGFMSKPYKIVDLEKLLIEYCGNGDLTLGDDTMSLSVF